MGEVEGWQGATVDRVIGATAGQALGILAALFLGPAGGLVGVAAEPVAEELFGALRRMGLRRLGRVQVAKEEAEAEAGCKFADLVLRSLDDDRRAGLLSAAFEAAASAGDEFKVKALGRAYARGVLATDDAKVDEQVRIVTTLAALDAIDIRVLDRTSSSPTWVIERGGNIPSVEERVPGAATVAESVVSRLSTLGLIRTPVSGGLAFGGAPAMSQVTKFGVRCLDALREVGEDRTEQS